MSQQSRFVQPDSNEMPTEIADLATAIDGLPAELRGKITPFVDRVVESTKRRRRILALVQDALGQLRLVVVSSGGARTVQHRRTRHARNRQP